MGIYYRYAAAALILLFCADTYSATRKTVSHGQSKASVVNGSGASFQTPNGEAAFYGQPFVDEHSAGARFNPGDNPTGKAFPPKPTMPVSITPTVKANPLAVAKAAVNLLKRGGPGAAAMAATAAAQWAIEQIDIPSATYDPETGIPIKNPPLNVVAHYYVGSQSRRYGTHEEACKSHSASYVSDGSLYCRNSSGQVIWTIRQQTLQCPYGHTNYYCDAAPKPPAPFNDEETAQLEDAFRRIQNSDWMRDLVKRSCEGSTAPDQCYDQLTDFGPLQGPASQLGPKVSTTTTTTRPDGTSSTSTVSMQNNYTYNFGPNHYNYSVTTNTTTNKDGQTTTETRSDTPDPTAEPDEDPLNDSEDDFDGTFQDSEFPEVPSFYQQKYPDGLSGVWQQARADVDQSAFMQFLQGFVPSFSGSCPAFGLGFNIASWANYGNIQFSSICYVLDFVKIILLVTALFTFRKVTFGG